ncbi:hypothetical protein ACVIAJ_07625 [Acinetobacter johnsonii]|uniref:Uncharacterized protein n=1 Tax=Acinetobacter johnsonii TaxID=40214 RepID=A0A1R7QG22_ACIJO|nr:hypothetical protein [Acinetobacter johnsonii]SJX23200.1 hypothetical protein ACNJC6_02856 [Acinetobacter johnsonii]
MRYTAQIIENNEELEFIVNIKIDSEILEVFSSSIPTTLDLNTSYVVDLEAIVFDDYLVEKTNSPPQIRQLSNSLGYEIIGHLKNGQIEANGLIFEDEILNSDFFYLDNSKVKWTVDRINADFVND